MTAQPPQGAKKRPNFLIIVADDLGFSDTSPYGGEIRTPNLAKLSSEGIRMTDFHTAPACSPTRSMLMSGTDHHIAGLGQLAEHMRQQPEAFEGRPGYEGYLNFRVAALPEILRDAGYFNVMSGKWHLGFKKEHAPYARGFEQVFSFLAGSGNHFNYEPQFDDPRYKFPWRNQLWMENDRYVDRKTEIPADFYSTTYATKRMMDFLKGRTEAQKQQPFFAYLAYLAPHWPLQAPKERWEQYKGWYKDGPSALSERRVKRLIELGLVPADVVPAKPEGWDIGKEWEDLTDQEREESARKMEVYAAMVEMIDEGVGEVVDYLESTGELDNTFVLFMSDNGAEGLMMEALAAMGDETTMADIINVYYTNTLDNMGAHDSFVWYGPRWASAATAPSRGWKAWPTEGGIRCPCIVRYPGFQNAGDAVTHKFTTVMDILPTVLDLAGVPLPGKEFHGREVVPVKGKSWVSHLSSKDLANTSVHDENAHVHGWELVGLRAIRKGPYKAVWMHPPRGNSKWELYNVVQDPAERVDLADAEPEKTKELIKCWEEYFTETGMFEYPFEFAVAKA
ncbi:alkaline phosphatase-like protein [Xylariomycetidae sp. FL0641]|nr:alkaline phosphatase-like protein [Xylariomycetidae sp. FL0641]